MTKRISRKNQFKKKLVNEIADNELEKIAGGAGAVAAKVELPRPMYENASVEVAIKSDVRKAVANEPISAAKKIGK